MTELLGRVVSYSDVWGVVTTPVYESLTGRVLRVTTAGPGVQSSTTAFAYDRDGKTTTVTFDGQVYAGIDVRCEAADRASVVPRRVGSGGVVG